MKSFTDIYGWHGGVEGLHRTKTGIRNTDDSDSLLISEPSQIDISASQLILVSRGVRKLQLLRHRLTITPTPITAHISA